MRRGLCPGPDELVCEPPEKQKCSHTALPAMVALASSRYKATKSLATN